MVEAKRGGRQLMPENIIDYEKMPLISRKYAMASIDRLRPSIHRKWEQDAKKVFYIMDAYKKRIVGLIHLRIALLTAAKKSSSLIPLQDKRLMALHRQGARRQT